MKPFNLEEALAGKPVRTRDGRPVVFGAYNPEVKNADAIIGWLGDCVYTWRSNGAYVAHEDSPADLFMVSEKHKVTRFMRSVFPGDLGYETKEDAERCRVTPDSKFVKVTLEWED